MGTTDYAPSDVSQGKRTYDYFLAKYLLDGSISSSFADNGIFQKDFTDTDKAFTLDIQDDGKILIAGMTWVNFGGGDARVTGLMLMALLMILLEIMEQHLLFLYLL